MGWAEWQPERVGVRGVIGEEVGWLSTAMRLAKLPPPPARSHRHREHAVCGHIDPRPKLVLEQQLFPRAREGGCVCVCVRPRV